MANRLDKMDIKQVHLTGSPAVRKTFLIVKSEGSMTDQEKEAQAKAEADKAEELKKSQEAEAATAKAEADAALAKSEQAAKDAVEAREKAETALKAREAELTKSAIAILKSLDSDEAKAAVESLEAKLEGKTIEKSTKSTEKEVAEILKSQLPEYTKSVTEPISKALDEAKKELEEIKKSNALLVGEKVEREIAEIAKSLVGDNEKNMEHVRLMKSKLDDETFKAFVEREKANAEMLRKSSTFKETGSNSSSGSNGSDAYQQLTDIANSIIQKSTEKVPFTDAFARACAERQDLFDEYRNASYANSSVRNED